MPISSFSPAVLSLVLLPFLRLWNDNVGFSPDV